MPKKPTRTVAPAPAAGPSSIQLKQIQSWLLQTRTPVEDGKTGVLLLTRSRKAKGTKKDKKSAWRGLGLGLAPWQEALLDSSPEETVPLETAAGPVWIARLSGDRSDSLSLPSPYAAARDAAGAAARAAARYKLDTLEVRLLGIRDEEELGALVGLELSAYRFREHFAGGTSAEQPALPRLKIKRGDGGKAGGVIERAAALGRAVNVARHLVNLPPANLNTRAYAEAVERLFSGSRTVTVQVWDESRHEAEKAGLLLAVGRGAEEGPRLVHLRYRPRGSQKGKQKKGKMRARPLAFVGKGIVFDTGGLDIKPSAGMRLMKKDMGGSAAMVGLALWLEATEHAQPCDLYLALAENAVDGRSYHPSDVVLSRAGIAVEIDNTDAEGRLVLADALDVAIKAQGDDAPSAVIDAATLTGAGKVGLGVEIASLFATHDGLAKALEKAGWESGDLCWRMPLFAPYRKKLASPFADMVNSAADGMGGAITAALFLERFVGKVPWAHLDMYGWCDGQKGGMGPGGSGQSVQNLVRFVQDYEGLGKK
ncbi:MAG TPA: leucyl aminopeptidase family protein [Bdellovibrionota bacterium]|nr:leucyl aminopeptidase family protein [Bdellovibrionota bacterium]